MYSQCRSPTSPSSSYSPPLLLILLLHPLRLLPAPPPCRSTLFPAQVYASGAPSRAATDGTGEAPQGACARLYDISKYNNHNNHNNNNNS